jgi:hypothetical protein
VRVRLDRIAGTLPAKPVNTNHRMMNGIPDELQHQEMRNISQLMRRSMAAAGQTFTKSESGGGLCSRLGFAPVPD